MEENVFQRVTTFIICISSKIRSQISLGGIGEVSTKPKYTGKKLASTLLLEATKYMESNSFLISSLHTGEAAPLYVSVGWKSIPRCFVKRQLSEISTSSSQYTISAIDLNSYEHSSKMQEMYDNYAKKYNGTYVLFILVTFKVHLLEIVNIGNFGSLMNLEHIMLLLTTTKIY